MKRSTWSVQLNSTRCVSTDTQPKLNTCVQWNSAERNSKRRGKWKLNTPCIKWKVLLSYFYTVHFSQLYTFAAFCTLHFFAVGHTFQRVLYLNFTTLHFYTSAAFTHTFPSYTYTFTGNENGRNDPSIRVLLP